MNIFDDFDEQSMRTMRGDTSEGTLGRIDQYDIIRKLGGGGFGVVYLVRDTLSNVEYAIKTLHPLLKSNPEEMENLRSQFSLVSKLSHPNIASAIYLHPICEVVYATEDVRKDLRLSPGDFVMVMKYAPGVTLFKWRKQFFNGIVPVDKAIDICKQIASALDYAHSEKIIHRDIKPGNIMVETCEAGSITARVLDFGLAAAEIRSSMSRVSTDEGDTSGTRPYMAPEQWRGKKQDAATDQYALAVVFYELVSGTIPFAGAFETGDFIIMINAVENRHPEALEELSEEQNQVLLKALSKSPKDRYDSCSTFLDVMLGKVTVQQQVNISSSNSNTKSIICINCNCENEVDSTFCVGCGAKIERDDICPKCGATLSENQMFCKKCGSKTPLCLTKEAERKVIKATKAKEFLRRKKKYIFGFLFLIIFFCIAISQILFSNEWIDRVQLWKNGPYWAVTNIGAEKPWDYGYYFWWGDTIGYKRENDKWVASDGSSLNFSFEESNVPTYEKTKSTLQSEGWITSNGVLAPEHDAARAHWGSNWRMPTDSELQALLDNCTWTWTSTNGVNGYIVRGKGAYSGASIFLPAAGDGDWTSLDLAGSDGEYWSSVPYSCRYYYDGSWNLYFDSSDHDMSNSRNRVYGRPVRPVSYVH